jgi:hypothetical protein
VQTNKKSSFKPLLFGVLAGALVAVTITSLTARRGRPTDAVTAEVDRASPAARDRPRPARPDWSAPQLVPAPNREQPAAARLDAVAEERKTFELLQAQLDAHRREATDAAWAAPAARAFTADLAVIQGKRNVRVGAVNCRSHTCSAELEWSSRELATNEWVDLLHYPYRYSCARMIVLPSASTPSAGPTKTTMLFECADRKKNDKNDPIPEQSNIAPPEEFAQAAPAAPAAPASGKTF